MESHIKAICITLHSRAKSTGKYLLVLFSYNIIIIFPPFSIDATEDKGQIARMINHSKKALNMIPQLVDIQGSPRVCFFAKRVLAIGEEILYDYGDSSPSAVKAHPWLGQ